LWISADKFREHRARSDRTAPSPARPIVTIVSVLAGAALLGILGALLAIPVAAAVQIMLKDWWAHRGQKSPAAAEVGESP
jgi:hypothetical protein